MDTQLKCRCAGLAVVIAVILAIAYAVSNTPERQLPYAALDVHDAGNGWTEFSFRGRRFVKYGESFYPID